LDIYVSFTLSFHYAIPRHTANPMRAAHASERVPENA
jgi:hypothetical protein